MTPVLGPVEARLVLDLAGLPGLRLEHALTRRVLAAIPAAHEHYRPRGDGRTTCTVVVWLKRHGKRTWGSLFPLVASIVVAVE